jgi:excisionase family DNA binding protein
MAVPQRRSTDKKPEKSWVTSGEVARSLNMTDAAIRRWAREGLLEAIKTPGGQYRFRREAVSNLTKAGHMPKGTRTKSRRTGTTR